jgi:uncharacterized protein (DUF3820 family)
MADIRMPFGKHNGEPIEDLPADYIEWCLENCDLRPALQSEMEAQLSLKRGEGVQRKRGVNG